ncbi:MAG: helix-turn-helix domain-containing protein, partial [Bryobacteraceae bacterium]
YGKEIRGLTQRAHIRLSQHSWPGNVRELENVLGCAAMMTITNMIDIEDLPAHLQSSADPGAQRQADALEGQERMLIVQALERAGGNQTQAARILRISRDRLRYKLKKHHLYVPDSTRGAAAAG